MHFSNSIGRTGGLAVALGIGAAVAGGCGIAWADAGSAGAAGPNAGGVTSATSAAAPGPGRANRARANAVAQPTARGSRSTAQRSSAQRGPVQPAASERFAARAAIAPTRSAASLTASATASATEPFSKKGITADPNVILDGYGNFLANMRASTTRADVKLVFSGKGGSNGGKVTLPALFDSSGAPLPQTAALLPYATWLDDGGSRGTETFKVSIREYTKLDQMVTSLPIINDLVFKPLIHTLQDLPLISTVLAPVIGSAVVVPIEVDVAGLSGSRTIAFTYDVPSTDRVKISTNYFPATAVAVGAATQAPTVIVGSGFGYAAQTAPFALYSLKDEVPGIGTLRDWGYSTITYDPRGRFDSTGKVHMASPNYEGKDVSSLISWLAAKTPAALNAADDPKVGLVGGSYGAALQFAAAADPRIDAMVPVDGWDTLLGSFYPGKTFRTGYGALTILSLLKTGSRVYPPLYLPFGTGMFADFIGPFGRKLLNDSNPPLDQLTAPTLMIRGIVDVLFPLEQGTASAEKILANGKNVPLKMEWICTGHGLCNDPYGPDQTQAMALATQLWLGQYVLGVPGAADIWPTFTWFDQRGKGFTAAKMPFQDGFNDLPPVVATDKGGLLPIVPILGGSGSLSIQGIVNGSSAKNSIKVDVPTDKLAVGTQVVGTPKVSFDYRGLGNAGAVYAQVVDKTTGLVLGNVVMPVPVRLDGFKHSVSLDIGEISYTVNQGDALQVQITSSATPFFNVPFGLIDISNVSVTLPNRKTP